MRLTGIVSHADWQSCGSLPQHWSATGLR